jgi:hypothetical protein
VRRDHAPLCVGQIGLVSGHGAAMLLSSSWRPHGESKVGSRNPLESRQLPLTRASRTEFGNRRLVRGIGLAQYAEMFRANDIDIELLGKLTNDISRISASRHSAIERNCCRRSPNWAVHPQRHPHRRQQRSYPCAINARCQLPLIKCRRRAHGSMIRVRFKRPHQAYATEIADCCNKICQRQTFMVTADPRAVQVATQSGVRR